MSQVKAVPDGMHTLTAHLVCADASRAIDFYREAFGATELARLPGPDGRLMHAMLAIGDSKLMLVDEWPEQGVRGPAALGGSPVTLHLAVPDVDAAFERAVRAGARATMPPTDMFWGDRYGRLVDPDGHQGSIATHVRDMTPEEIRNAMSAAACGAQPAGAPAAA